MLTLAVGVVVLSLAAGHSSAGTNDFSSQGKPYAKLSASFRSIQDGKPFRDALQTVADQLELNLWLDRSVDPTAPVNAGPVGPTVFAALKQIAESRQCVVMPVAGAVLVGRPGWVDRTTASLLSLQSPDGSGVREVKWDTLSTPQQAMESALGRKARGNPALPHDLWPEVDWRGLDRSVAATLVLAQFDRRAKDNGKSFSNPRSQTWESVPSTDEAKLTRRYFAGAAAVAARAAAKGAGNSVKADNGWLTIRSPASTHRAVTTAMLDHAATKIAAAGPNDDLTFKLKPTTAPAGSLLISFAKTGGRDCVIEPDAVGPCQKVITVEANDETIRELVTRVAAEVGVEAVWEGERILIRAK